MSTHEPRPADPSGSGGATALEQTLFEVKKVIVGQDRAVERLLVCLLARGHALLEGVPGLAKTLAAETLARVVGGSFTRVQFTPDLLPADIMGTRIYRAATGTFDVELGPVFANFVLADEINRAPAKVQSALLEVMAEHQVSIGGETFPVPQPFLVLATQNPIEQEGVYPLPEAQRDRFLMKIVIDYPTPGEEVEIVQRMGVNRPEPREVLSIERLAGLQREADGIYVDRAVIDYAVSLVLATRDPDRHGLHALTPMLSYGASPRASLGLVAAARALAYLRGRRYALPQDVFDVAPDVLRHRLVLSYEALAQGVGPEQILARLLSTVPAPRIAPSQDGPGAGAAGVRPDPASAGPWGAPATGQGPTIPPGPQVPPSAWSPSPSAPQGGPTSWSPPPAPGPTAPPQATGPYIPPQAAPRIPSGPTGPNPGDVRPDAAPGAWGTPPAGPERRDEDGTGDDGSSRAS